MPLYDMNQDQIQLIREGLETLRALAGFNTYAMKATPEERAFGVRKVSQIDRLISYTKDWVIRAPERSIITGEPLPNTSRAGRFGALEAGLRQAWDEIHDHMERLERLEQADNMVGPVLERLGKLEALVGDEPPGDKPPLTYRVDDIERQLNEP